VNRDREAVVFFLCQNSTSPKKEVSALEIFRYLITICLYQVDNKLKEPRSNNGKKKKNKLLFVKYLDKN
jgi:hypothetical protein